MLTPALYLIPVTLNGEEPEKVLPAYNFQVIRQIDEFIVENVRSARRFLRSVGYEKDFSAVKFHVLDKHTDYEEIPEFIRAVGEGKAVGLLSEAGVPCVADPGNIPVRLCQEADLKVVPLSGPSSIILALMASGFNGQQFAFHGYLPVESGKLKRKLKELESLARKYNQTQIFIETPFRNQKLFETIMEVCSGNTMLSLAKNLTLENESVKTKSVFQWKQNPPGLQKQPCVFLIYK